MTDDDNENILCVKNLPNIDDILSYINSFISCQQKANSSIFKYYFIIDAVSKISKFLKNNSIKIAINVKKLYEMFVKAIKKRIKIQIFYSDSVEFIDDDMNILKNIFANIGKNNVIMFEAQAA